MTLIAKNIRFGRLIPISIVGRDKWKNIIWKCKCDCGNFVERPITLLKKGHTKSCGCLRKEKFHKLIYKHGLRRTKIYRVWASMIQRCNNLKGTGYKNYGGRGIKIYEKWTNFKFFFKDMGEGYKENLEIDRINNNGNYEPNNCRWITKKENLNNKRTNHLIKYKNKTKNLKQWSEELGIKYTTLQSRIITYGWKVERAFNFRNI